ncbi:MAG TPA: hypothetical protein VIO62_15405 [Candidatus Dormibacteraeota bacterium]|jgi:hypothetical protein
MRDNTPTQRKRKLAILAALGLGVAMASRRRRWQRYAFSQMHQGGAPEGFAGARGFGGHGPWRRGWPPQDAALPPMIEAKLRAWHDQAHRQAASGGGAEQPGGPTQV